MINVAAVTSKGMVRIHNEDCAAVDGIIIKEGEPATFTISGNGDLLVLADGMGGHAKGDVASRLAVESLNRIASTITEPSSCIEAIRTVNRELYQAMNSDEDLRGMGTTIVGLLFQGERAIWFNVGDSRAYLLRHDLRQLTTDHVPSGDTIGTSRRSHAITQSLGGRYGQADVWPATGAVEIIPEDKILICSDGLTDLLSDREITDFLLDKKNPEAIARRFIETALARGAPDNVTVIVASL